LMKSPRAGDRHQGGSLSAHPSWRPRLRKPLPTIGGSACIVTPAAPGSPRRVAGGGTDERELPAPRVRRQRRRSAGPGDDRPVGELPGLPRRHRRHGRPDGPRQRVLLDGRRLRRLVSTAGGGHRGPVPGPPDARLGPGEIDRDVRRLPQPGERSFRTRLRILPPAGAADETTTDGDVPASAPPTSTSSPRRTSSRRREPRASTARETERANLSPCP